MSGQDLSDLSMMDLFRLDADSQAQTLDAGLLALERDAVAAAPLEACMRAAHSLKGAARVIGLNVGVEVAHALEDCFVAAQRGALLLGRAQIDVLLQGADLLKRIAHTPEPQLGEWAGARDSRSTYSSPRCATPSPPRAWPAHRRLPPRRKPPHRKPPLHRPRPRRRPNPPRSRVRPTRQRDRPSRPASKTARSATACSA